MPSHHERRPMPWTPAQLCELVADVEKYPQFIPWCVASRVTRRDGDTFWAELVIGFKMIRESYVSRVKVTHPHRIDIDYERGPFKSLTNIWIFEDDGKGGTVVDFQLDFEFRSRLLAGVMSAFFQEAVRLMVGAFEKRARELYGPGKV